MSVGFLITLPDQIDRFEPVARRVPGARFVLPRGKWPSCYVDSRRWSARILTEHGYHPATEPNADLDLLVTTGEMPAIAARSWLRERGTLVLWREDPARQRLVDADVVIAPGEKWLPPHVAGVAVGDPRLDVAAEPGAATRARNLLGLSGDRPVILIHASAGGQALDRLAPALASLRADADLVVTAAHARWVQRRDALPACLRGPGISVVVEQPALGELLAAADVVLSEPSLLLFQASALNKPALGIGRPNLHLHPRITAGPLGGQLHRLDWIDEAAGIHRRVERALAHPHAFLEEAQPACAPLTGPCDGRAAQRFAAALRLAHPQLDPVALG